MIFVEELIQNLVRDLVLEKNYPVPDETEIKKSAKCWEEVKKFFRENIKNGSTTIVSFVIDPEEPNTISLNYGSEIDTAFSREEILGAGYIASQNGLAVKYSSSEDELNLEFVEISFTAPDFTNVYI